MPMPDLLEEGRNLFNAGKFYEAHEVWEDLWRVTNTIPLKTCYQGLIQAAVGLHHLNRQNLHGARNQLRKSIRNLEAGAAESTGLDVGSLVRQLAGVLERLHEAPPPDPGLVHIARLK
jgi:hypothetical protein